MIYLALLISIFGLFAFLTVRGRNFDREAQEGQADSVGLGALISTLLATAIGGGLILGLIQFGMLSGVIGVLLALVYCFSFIGLGLLAPMIRASCASSDGIGNRLSMTQVLAERYPRWVWAPMLLGYVAVYIAFLAAQFVALAVITRAMGVDLSVNTLVIGSAAATLLYVTLGGYVAVLVTERVQMVIVGLLLISSMGMLILNGFPDFASAPSSYWNPLNPDYLPTFAWIAAFVFPTLLLRLDHWQRIVTASDDQTARRAYVIAGIILIAVFGVLLLVGASARFGGDGKPFYLFHHVLIDSVGGTVGTFLHALILVSMVCAIISSADTIANASAACVSQTLGAWGIGKESGILRIVAPTVVITVLALALALLKPNVVKLITEGFKAMTILLPAVAAAVFFKAPSARAAMASLVAGVTAYVAVGLLSTSWSQWAFVAGFLSSLLGYILAFASERRSASIEERD